MKQLFNAGRYPIQITQATYSGGDRSTVEFNLNNLNWSLLKRRLNAEYPISRSTIFLRFPPAGDDTTALYRKYECQYSLNTKKLLPGETVPTTVNVENFILTPLTGTVKRTTDYDLGHPADTFMATDEAVDPTDISGFMWIKCNVSPYVVQGQQYWTQPYAELLLNPIWKVPTIFGIEARQNGVAVTSVDPRQPIELTWTSNIQDLGEVRVYQGETYVTTIDVGTNKSCTIPAYTIPNVGQTTFRIVAANNPLDNLGVTGSADLTVNATVPAVAASNFSLDQLEKRTPIVGTWDSTNQSDFKLEVLRNGAVEHVLTGGTAKTFTIPPGTLTEGELTFKLTVNNTFGTATTTVVLSIDRTITFSKPLIVSLEPDKLNQNLDLALPITWICDNQDTYNLKVYREDKLEKEFTGSIDKSITLPPKTLKSGDIRLLLTITNTINSIVGTSSREATFFGYGTPDAPTFEDVEIYNQALPLIKWVSSEQEYYDFKISALDGTVHEASGEILSTNKQYQVTKDLLNNTQYELSLRIKSSFGLWSTWTEKTVLISYTQLDKPIIELVPDTEGNIIVTIKNPDVPEFENAEIWRKTDYTEWVRLVKDQPPNNTWSDPTAAAGVRYYYRCIANAVGGGRTQSDIVSTIAYFSGFYLIDVENTDRRLELLTEDTTSESPVVVNTVSDEVATLFVGARAPVIEKGVTGYQTIGMKFILDLDSYKLLEDMKKKSKLLLYKDEAGNKIYGNIQGNLQATPKRWFTNWLDVNFNFVENNFLEQDIASNVKMVLHLFDGTYMFDGSIDLSGRHWEVI